MSRKLFFEDGSTIEVSVTPVNGGKLATAAYQRLIEFIDNELMDEFEISFQADDLDILEDDLEEVDLDEVDLDEIDLDEDVDESDDFDDELIDDDEEEEWGDDDDDFTLR